jgi:hypothetical protein
MVRQLLLQVVVEEQVMVHLLNQVVQVEWVVVEQQTLQEVVDVEQQEQQILVAEVVVMELLIVLTMV